MSHISCSRLQSGWDTESHKGLCPWPIPCSSTDSIPASFSIHSTSFSCKSSEWSSISANHSSLFWNRITWATPEHTRNRQKDTVLLRRTHKYRSCSMLPAVTSFPSANTSICIWTKDRRRPQNMNHLFPELMRIFWRILLLTWIGIPSGSGLWSGIWCRRHSKWSLRFQCYSRWNLMFFVSLLWFGQIVVFVIQTLQIMISRAFS